MEKILLIGGRKSTEYKQLGLLATAIKQYFTDQNDELMVYDKEFIINGANIKTIIYTEKDGERLQDTIDICQKFGINLLNLATGVMGKMTLPDVMNFSLVDAPNANIDILKQINQIREDAKQWSHKKHLAIITEAHQWSKASTPGTAIDIKSILGDLVLHDTIYSIRSPQIAQLIGIPTEHLSGFGFHLIEIYDKENINKGVPMKGYILEVHGRKSYAVGVYKIVKAINKLEKRNYHISELIDMKVI